MRPCWALIAAVILALAGCKAEKPKTPPPKPVQEAEFKPADVIAGAQKSLGWVASRDGIVYVNDEKGLDTMIAFPVAPHWRIVCGMLGIKLVIAQPGTNALEIQLSDACLEDTQCARVIGPIMTTAKARFATP